MNAFLFFVLALVFAPLKGYAYLDLGTGSYMLQILVATLIGGVYAVKIHWQKIKAYFKNLIAGKRLEQ